MIGLIVSWILPAASKSSCKCQIWVICADKMHCNVSLPIHEVRGAAGCNTTRMGKRQLIPWCGLLIDADSLSVRVRLWFPAHCITLSLNLTALPQRAASRRAGTRIPELVMLWSHLMVLIAMVGHLVAAGGLRPFGTAESSRPCQCAQWEAISTARQDMHAFELQFAANLARCGAQWPGRGGAKLARGCRLCCHEEPLHDAGTGVGTGRHVAALNCVEGCSRRLQNLHHACLIQ
jgi:hypothetical protein